MKRKVIGMGLEQFTGTPWHTDKFTRAEGDARRHSHRCINYKSDGSCKYFLEERCRGAAHCDHYKENRIEKEETKAENPNTFNEKPKKELTDQQAMELFPVGDKVLHDKFGTGTILESSAQKIRVLFEGGTEKKFSTLACLGGGLLSVEHVEKKASTQRIAEQPRINARSVTVEIPKYRMEIHDTEVSDFQGRGEKKQPKVATIKQDTEVVAKIEIPIAGVSFDEPKKETTGNAYMKKEERVDNTVTRAKQDVEDPFESFLKKCSEDEEAEREQAKTYKKFNEEKKEPKANREFQVAMVVFILCLIATLIFVLKEFVV